MSRPQFSGSGWFLSVAPLLFVFLWSTGFIGTKFAALNADPFAYLAVRFTLAALIMTAITLALRAEWPRGRAGWGQAATAGLLLHAGYLGFVTYAIWLHFPAGITSVIVGLQPVLTGLLAGPLLGEKVSARQWLGLVLGFLGVALTVLGRAPGDGVVTVGAVSVVLVALFCTTGGTLYQKHAGAHMPLLGGAAVQYMASAVVTGVVWAVRGGGEIHWNVPFTLALTWLVLLLSVGAILILMFLIREMPAARVSSLLYLVPPLTVMEAYLLFVEKLSLVGWVGLLLCVVGVALAAFAPRRAG